MVVMMRAGRGLTAHQDAVLNPIVSMWMSGWVMAKRKGEPIPLRSCTIGRDSESVRSRELNTHMLMHVVSTEHSSILLGPRSSYAWPSSDIDMTNQCVQPVGQ